MVSRMMKNSLTAAGVTRETLEDTPSRVLEFLSGISVNEYARHKLGQHGYNKKEHDFGWALLQAAVQRSFDDDFGDFDARSAIAFCDEWEEGGIRLIRAALTRHPEARERVLHDIVPKSGAGSVLNVQTLLERIEALRGTPGGDAALATLAARGVDEKTRQELAEAVRVVQGGGVEADPLKSTKPDDEAVHEQALLALREWFVEWSEIARLCIERRDALIRLGLAERRSADNDTNVRMPADGSGPFIDPKSEAA